MYNNVIIDVISLQREVIMTLKLNKIDIKTQIKNFLLMVLGTAILAFGTAIFLLPYGLVTGGVSGIAIVLREFFLNVFALDFD